MPERDIDTAQLHRLLDAMKGLVPADRQNEADYLHAAVTAHFEHTARAEYAAGLRNNTDAFVTVLQELGRYKQAEVVALAASPRTTH